MKEWLKVIPAHERSIYESAGFVSNKDLGKRPCLIVVDVTYGFTGSEGLTLEEAVAEFHTACGPAGWEAMPRIARLIELFRRAALPIVFTRSDLDGTAFAGKATNSRRKGKPPAKFNEFPPAIEPRQGEWVLEGERLLPNPPERLLDQARGGHGSGVRCLHLRVRASVGCGRVLPWIQD